MNNNNNKDNNKPKQYRVDSYDYSSICNYNDCDEKPEICINCLERTGKFVFGHRHEHIKLRSTPQGKVYEETETHIKVKIKIMHAHFALKKGTKVPELDDSRNVWCTIGERWADKETETYVTRKMKDHKPLPEYLKDEIII